MPDDHHLDGLQMTAKYLGTSSLLFAILAIAAGTLVDSGLSAGLALGAVVLGLGGLLVMRGVEHRTGVVASVLGSGSAESCW
jgi:hypothetical protein